MKNLIGLFSIAVSIGIVALLTSMNTEPEESQAAAERMQVPIVVVYPVEVTDSITGYGRVIPRWETVLASEVSGRVLSVSDKFLSGMAFKKGEVLAIVDETAYVAALEASKLALATAKRVLVEEKQRSKIAAENWKTSGFQGKPDDLLLRKPQLEEGRLAIQSALAAVKKARNDLDRTRIRAPYNGCVTTRLINPGDFLDRGTPVGKIYDKSLYEVAVPLSTDQVSRLAQFGEVDNVKVYSVPSNRTYAGAISRIEQMIDPKNRWQNVVVTLKDPSGVLPGEFIRVEFKGRSYEGVLAVPENIPANDGYVWFVDPQDSLQRFLPDVLFRKQGMLFIRSPFAGEEKIRLTVGRNVFLPGQVVDPFSRQPETIAQRGDKDVQK